MLECGPDPALRLEGNLWKAAGGLEYALLDAVVEQVPCTSEQHRTCVCTHMSILREMKGSFSFKLPKEKLKILSKRNLF